MFNSFLFPHCTMRTATHMVLMPFGVLCQEYGHIIPCAHAHGRWPFGRFRAGNKVIVTDMHKKRTDFARTVLFLHQRQPGADSRIAYCAVSPVTFCKGLFNHIHKKFTFQGKKIEPGTCFLGSRLINFVYVFLSTFLLPACFCVITWKKNIISLNSYQYNNNH